MKLFSKITMVPAVLTLMAATALPAAAADLGGWGRGSIKDYAPAPVRAPAGPCYFRGDVGYSMAQEPTLRWSAFNPPAPYRDKVTNSSMDDAVMVEAGAGCGSGSRGFRSELMLGYRGERGVSGTTSPFVINPGDPAHSSPISSKLTTYTAMVNAYYDLGAWRGIVPYLGVGIGLAYNQMSEYSIFHPNMGFPNAPWTVSGENDLTLAWSLMAGFGWQISDRAILDLGYRYIDFGRAATSRFDNFGFGNLSRLNADDLAAHEFKLGLRYHFGGGGDCCMQPVALK
jgi:opacity protein-like surface antigen